MASESDGYAWSVSGRDYMQRQIDDLKEQLNERDAANRRAVDAALAAATAALDRSEANLSKEFHEHLVQYRHETSLAFEASDKAINKADAATEKRFASVNEFRAQLNDQAQRFLARTEYDAAHNALVAKVEEQAKHLNERLTEINRRLDLNQGRSSIWAVIPIGIGALLGIIGIVSFFNAG